MTYPLQACETQPLIDVRNITLKDINSTGGPLPAGIIRCNETNPCEDISFENVHMTSWWNDMEWSWITEYANGEATEVVPKPIFNKGSDNVFELYSVEHLIMGYE